MRNLGLVLLLFFSTQVWCVESDGAGFYVGGALGFAELDEGDMDDNLNSFDDNSGTARIFGGYQFNPYLAAEVSLDSLGSYEGETATADLDSSYSALLFSLMGRVPLGAGLSLFLQGGGGVASIYQVADGMYNLTYYDDEDASSSGFATAFGGGLSFLIPNHNEIEIRAGYLQTEFEVDVIHVNALGNLVEDEYDQSVKQLYLGGAYHF